MNGRIVWRVMWKEYRALRGLWIAVAVASWLAQVAILLSAMDLGMMEVAYAAALVTPVFYVFGAAAAVFAGECEDGADRLLLALPTPLASLAAGKMAFVALSTLALIPAAGVLAVWALSQPTAAPLRLDQDVSALAFIWAPAILEGFVWGLFFSLKCRNVMQAACLATLAAAVTVSVALHLSSSSAINGVDPWQYAETLWPRLGLVLVVLVADLVLARRWLSERLLVAADASHEAAGASSWSARATQWLSQLLRWHARLTWQQLRQSTRLMAVVVCVPIAISLLIPQLSERVRIPEPSREGLLGIDVAWEATLMILAALVGCTVFSADKRNRSYRCLAEQGCGAGTVWLNRQAFGLVWLVGAIVVWHLAWWLRFGQFNRPIAEFEPFNNYGFRSGDRDPWNLMSWREFGAVATCYAAGQFASLLLTGSIVSTLVGLVLAAGFYAWSFLMLYLLLPPSLTVWPLAAGMLATTAVFARGWLLDNRGPRTWLSAGATFTVFGGFTLALIPSLRLDRLPDPPLAFDVEEFRATLGPEAQQTAELYRRAVETMRTRREIEEEVSPPNAETGEGEPLGEVQGRWERGEVSEVDRAWVAANAEPLRLVLEANEQPTCAFVRPLPDFKGRTIYELGSFMLLGGSRSEADLDTQLTAYADLLRMVNHLRPNSESFDAANSLEHRALDRLVKWAALPGQTPERLRHARRLLEAHVARTPGVDEVVKMQYLELLREIASAEPAFNFWFDRYLADLPWERRRAARLLTIWANHNLETIDQALNHMSPAALERMHGYEHQVWELVQVFSTPALRVHLDNRVYSGHWLAEAALNRLARVRASILLLELMAVRLEQGELPAELVELVNDDFPALPLDPFTGANFEYFPHGFPVELRQFTQLGGDLTENLEVGPPTLWSPGSRVQMTIQQEHGQAVRKFQHFRGDRWESLETDLGGWRSGLIFRIPQPEAF